MASSGCLYFTEIEPSRATVSGKPIAAFRLWKWDRVKGFNPISGTSFSIGELCLKPDDTQFLVPIEEPFGRFAHYQVDTKSGTMTPYPLPREISSLDAMIDSDTVLFEKMDKVPTRMEPIVDANRQLWVFHRSTKQMERVMPTHNLQQAIVFQGKIWALENQNGLERVVQLSHDLNHIEKAIPIREVR